MMRKMNSNPLVLPLAVNQDVNRRTVLKKVKRAYFVMGATSSGTRLMGRLLVAAGCSSDGTVPAIKNDHNDLWETVKPTANQIVMRRHSPVGRKPFWAKDPNIIKALWMEDYDVVGIVMSRCQVIVEQSMLAAPHTDELSKARGQTGFFWKSIMQNIPDQCPFEVVQYESLVNQPELYLKLLGERWGLQFPDSIECITDGNQKYWEVLRASQV